MRAPGTALIPTGPSPNTATAVPASTGNRHIARPRPQALTHASSDNSAAGTLVQTGTTNSSQVTRISEYPLGPFAIRTGVLSAISADGIFGRPSITQM